MTRSYFNPVLLGKTLQFLPLSAISSHSLKGLKAPPPPAPEQKQKQIMTQLKYLLFPYSLSATLFFSLLLGTSDPLLLPPTPVALLLELLFLPLFCFSLFVLLPLRLQ